MNYRISDKSFAFHEGGPQLVGLEDYPDVKRSLTLEEKLDVLELNIKIENSGTRDISTKISLYTGIDSYMAEYPQWNEKLFPTMLRCEETHFYGYCMSPIGDILGIACEEPIASYRLLYNGDGHRIESVELDLINPIPLPERYPRCLKVLRAGETLERTIFFFAAKSLVDVLDKAEILTHAPMIHMKKWTIQPGEKFDFEVTNHAILQIKSPSGKLLNHNEAVWEYGLYQIEAENNGKISQALGYCRKPWDFYLKEARKRAIEQPQKATTHTESWYGLFSGYLAAKHYPDRELDKLIEQKFREIVPYMFDMEKGEPKVIVERVQNTAMMISLLVDRFEASRGMDTESLVMADRLFEFLSARQREDGAYLRNGNLHYTCVIYIAKSVLELYLAEKEIDGFEDKAKKHFESAKKAIDNLVYLLDNIGTEGEQTFEDGMISCSALQIAMFALIMEENDRQKYIEAAEIMLEKHLCLEQKLIPDCRMRNASLRYWEAQYDVLTKPNMMNSPHGWTAWTMYAKYYLYLLTGRLDYLKDLIDGMGACVQLMDLNGNLRWSFICDPYVEADVFVKDQKRGSGYSGKYVKKVIGEQYLDMISGWYTHDKQVPTGGYLGCPLFLKEETRIVDNQGGCCDNDVHEIFKCLEETVLKKAFFHRENSTTDYSCSCSVNGDRIVLNEGAETLIAYVYEDTEFYLNDKKIYLPGGKITIIS